jgi:predicted enzyme related to lactoylglutathione lyase
MEPFDLPGDSGRMAVWQDGEGAYFSIYQSRGNVGAQLVNEVGSWTWNNLVTRDLGKATDFYGRVFGWRAEPSPEAPPESPYLMWNVEGQRWDEGLAGVSTADSDFPPDVPPHWQVYFAVPSADDAVSKTTAAGGQSTFGPVRIPVGTMAILMDPQGAIFGIVEPDYPEPR